MMRVTIFFRQHVRGVVCAWDMMDGYEARLYGLSYSIFAQLNMSDGPGGAIFGPMNAGHAVIVDVNGLT